MCYMLLVAHSQFFCCCLTSIPVQIFREQLLACDQDPEGIRYAKKFDIATRGLLETIKKFRLMKSIVEKKARSQVLRNKFVGVLKIFGKDFFETVVNLLSLKKFADMDVEEVKGKKSAHDLLEEETQAAIRQQNAKLEEILRKQKERADFLAGNGPQKSKAVDQQSAEFGAPVVAKPIFMRRSLTTIKPRKQDMKPAASADVQPAAPNDEAAAARPKPRMSMAQLHAMLHDQTRQAREQDTPGAQEAAAAEPHDDNVAGVSALARETGHSPAPAPPTGARLMNAMGAVRAKLRAGLEQSRPAADQM